MAPRNVVLVGASDRNWAPRIWDNLKRFGYEGQVFPVKPNRDEPENKAPTGPRVSVPLAPRPDPSLA